ncbi:MAG: ATP-binding protein [Bacteroidales bacterium]|nr:ATP-binding protein [Bacteroidales bacterium]
MPERKIAVASGKGGTGKTTVAVNLFEYIRSFDPRPVQLIDCDVEEPNTGVFINAGELIDEQTVAVKVPVINKNKCLYCGKCAEFCAYNAIIFVKSVPYIQVMPDLCHGCGACTYACDVNGAITERDNPMGKVFHYRLDDQSTRIEGQLDVGKPFAVPVIRQVKKTADPNKLCIIDAPPGTSCPVIETIHDVDYVILVTEPTPFGFSDLKLMVETVRQTEVPFGVVINRSGLGNREVYDYLDWENIQLLAEIPFDRAIADAYAGGKMLVHEVDGIKAVMKQIWEQGIGILNHK